MKQLKNLLSGFQLRLGFIFAADWIFSDNSCRIKVKDAVYDMAEYQNVLPGILDFSLLPELLVEGIDGIAAFFKGLHVHPGYPEAEGHGLAEPVFFPSQVIGISGQDGQVAIAGAVDLLLVNNVFTSKEFVDELGDMGLAMNPDELETLLNLQKGTLLTQKTEPVQMVMLKSKKQ